MSLYRDYKYQRCEEANKLIILMMMLLDFMRSVSSKNPNAVLLQESSRVESLPAARLDTGARGWGFYPALDQGDAHAPWAPQHKAPRLKGRGFRI
jgi:hypothetical protein